MGGWFGLFYFQQICINTATTGCTLIKTAPAAGRSNIPVLYNTLAGQGCELRFFWKND
jgi:hypothetical protein